MAGIDVYVHWTFTLLLAFIAYLFMSQGATAMAAALGVVFVLAVFGCVVLHELGHALMARRFGVPTRDITLLPIGGVARLQRMPEHPGQELLVAVAGPLVNVVIAVVLAVALAATGGLSTAAPVSLTAVARGNFLGGLMWLNIFLVLFNMLPAFPMDGGRVLRALLAFRLEYTLATNIAARIGQTMAVLFGFVGLMGGAPILVFIALFVFLGASAESQQAEIRTLLSSVAVEEAMLSRFRTLEMHDSVGRAIDELLAGSQHDFPIFEDGQYVGMLVRKDLIEGLNVHGRAHPLATLITRQCPTAQRHEPLDDVLRRMQEAGCTTMPVFSGDRFVGVLTAENVGEFMMIRSALQQRGRTPRPPSGPPREQMPDPLSPVRTGR